MSTPPRECYLDQIIGRPVRGRNNETVGRIEEVRIEVRDDDFVVTGYVLGGAGLVERLGVAARRLVGWQVGGHVATWDQIDLTEPERPRLTCRVEELREL